MAETLRYLPIVNAEQPRLRVVDKKYQPEQVERPERKGIFRAFDPMRDINRVMEALQRSPQDWENMIEMAAYGTVTFQKELAGAPSHIVEYEWQNGDLVDSRGKIPILQLLERGKHAGNTQEDIERNLAEQQAWITYINDYKAGKIANGSLVVFPTLQALDPNSPFHGNFVDTGKVIGSKLIVERYTTELNAVGMANVLNKQTTKQIDATIANPTSLKSHYWNLGVTLVDQVKERFKLGASDVTSTEMELILVRTNRARERYVEHLREIPPSLTKLEDDYTALVNATDKAIADIRSGRRIGTIFTDNDLDIFSSLEITARNLPCGAIGSEDIESYFAEYGMIDRGFNPNMVGEVMIIDGKAVVLDGWPIMEFRNGQPASRIIACETAGCKARYLRAYLGPLEPCCRACGGTEGIACEPGQQAQQSVKLADFRVKDLVEQQKAA